MDNGLISAYSDMKCIHIIKTAKCWGNMKIFLSQFLNILVYIQLMRNSTKMNGAIIYNYKTVSWILDLLHLMTISDC